MCFMKRNLCSIDEFGADTGLLRGPRFLVGAYLPWNQKFLNCQSPTPNGNVSIDLEVTMKLMFLLFCDNAFSE